MHLLSDQLIEALSHIRIEFIMDCSDQIGFHPQHRLVRHPLDYADAGDNDAPRAQLVEQSIEQNTPVHVGHGFDFQPGHHDTARWPAQIGEAEARLDGGKLIVAGRRSPREVGDGARSEEHTSELQSLMRSSYAVFCLKKKKKNTYKNEQDQSTQ